MKTIELSEVHVIWNNNAIPVSVSVAAAQKSCRDWIKQTIVFIVDSFCCFVSIVSRSTVLIQLFPSWLQGVFMQLLGMKRNDDD